MHVSRQWKISLRIWIWACDVAPVLCPSMAALPSAQFPSKFPYRTCWRNLINCSDEVKQNMSMESLPLIKQGTSKRCVLKSNELIYQSLLAPCNGGGEPFRGREPKIQTNLFIYTKLPILQWNTKTGVWLSWFDYGCNILVTGRLWHACRRFVITSL